MYLSGDTCSKWQSFEPNLIYGKTQFHVLLLNIAEI